MKRLVLWSGMVVIGLLPPLVQAEAIDAARLYEENCAICHGDKGDGKTATQSGLVPRPRDFTSAQAAMELTRERMIYAVTNGRRGTAMMSHKGRLSPQEIEAIVDYVRATFMQAPVETEASRREPPLLSLGEAVYTQNCSVCHGDKGNTAYWARNGLKPPPRDFTGEEAKSILTRQRMITSVTHGRPGTGMQPFKSRLSAQEIEAVVTYIRYQFMGVAPGEDTGLVPSMLHHEDVSAADSASQPGAAGEAPAPAPVAAAPSEPVPHPASPRPSPHGAGLPGTRAASDDRAADMSLPMPKGLTGNALAGRDFFMKNCFTCHGIKGEGNGPRAYFNIPRPRNFTSPESRRVLNRPRIFKSISEGRLGTVMPAWGKVLNDQQIADIAEFVFRAFIQDVKPGGVEQPPPAAAEGKKKVR